MCTFHISQNPMTNMWKAGLVLLALLSTSSGAFLFQCPEEATCADYGHIESNTLEFLNKFTEKQYLIITHLTATHASLEKLDPKLKYLRNLEYLDLSHNNIQVSSLPSLPNLKILKLADNNIKQFRFADLPHGIEELDLSNNLLTQIPKDWDTLKSLKSIRLYKNPIDCECLNVLTIMKFRIGKTTVSDPIICHTPKEFAGKDIHSTNCSIDDLMIYDEPYIEGSGAGDIFKENIQTFSIPHISEEDDNIIEENTIIDDKEDNEHLASEVVESKESLPSENDEQLIHDVDTSTFKTVLEEEEGSGDEGSGFIDIEIPVIPACHINCSTPGPIGNHDEQGASELPNPSVQIQIVAEDIYHGIKGDEAPTTASSTTSSTTPKEFLPAEADEVPIEKEVDIHLFRESDKQTDKDSSSHETKTAEKMEKASALNESSYAVYAVVAVGLLLAVVCLVCLVRNRKNKRNKKRREIPHGYGEEMKPLGKPAIQAVNEKNGKSNNIPENAPLINGNGKAKDEPILTAFTPLAHPEIIHSEDVDEEPELRSKPEFLTPTTERVTIRASEIPDSIPKTPLLVDRKKNSDGEIITTVLPP